MPYAVLRLFFILDANSGILHQFLIKLLVMKKTTRILRIVLIVILLLVLIGTMFIRHLRQMALPDYSRNIPLKGLYDSVEVIRDSLGIPHVFAKNEHDLYMAVGYILAQDRMWQMDLLRRVTTGRLSEIFGSSFATTDQLLRALRYSDKSNRILDSCSAELKTALLSFSEGVNQYLQHQGTKLPLEFRLLGYQPEPWEPVHSLNLIGYMAWDLKSGWSEIMVNEIVAKVGDSLASQIIPSMNWYKSFIYNNLPAVSGLASEIIRTDRFLEESGLQVFKGSNNWVVSGKKTASGKPMLANDMHLSFGIPGIWYQMQQIIPGKLNVTGVVLPGQPLVICGHNDSIAWGMTNAYVDNVDFFLETVNPQDTNQYLFNGNWRKMEIRKEKIRTKEGTEIERINRFTHRGPVVSSFKGFGDKVVSMHWPGDEYSNEMRTVYLLNHAHNWKDFTNAVSTFLAVSQNIVYADVSGNIGMFYAAGIPIRKEASRLGFRPGDTDAYDWKGFVPSKDLPYVFNPPSGYVASANNRPAGDDFPWFIGRWFSLPYRYDRICQLLDSADKMNTDDFVRIQTDETSLMAKEMLPGILSSAGQAENLSALEKQILDTLTRWDGTMRADQTAPLVFETLYQHLFRLLLADEMGDTLFRKYYEESSMPKFAVYAIWRNPCSAWCDNVNTPDRKETLSDIIRLAFHQSVDSLRNMLGDDISRWKWGEVHTLTLAHPLGKVALLDKLFRLNRGPFRTGGSFHTVRPYSYSFGTPFTANHGASERHIFDLSNWDNSLTVIPTGNSGIPGSPFYCNQTSLYISDAYHPDVFFPERVRGKKMVSNVFLPVQTK